MPPRLWSQISYFASAGDIGSEVLFPGASPWVSAGGTTINRDASGNFLSESCWSDTGGGPSAVETWQSPPSILNGMGPWADYQYELFGQTLRSTPDLSFDADPRSGVNVYDTDSALGGFFIVIVGGTSVSSPALAVIVNASNNGAGRLRQPVVFTLRSRATCFTLSYTPRPLTLAISMMSLPDRMAALWVKATINALASVAHAGKLESNLSNLRLRFFKRPCSSGRHVR